MDWAVSCWIVRAETGSSQCWSAGSGCGTPLQKQERKGGGGGGGGGGGVSEGFARGRSDA